MESHDEILNKLLDQATRSSTVAGNDTMNKSMVESAAQLMSIMVSTPSGESAMMNEYQRKNNEMITASTDTLEWRTPNSYTDRLSISGSVGPTISSGTVLANSQKEEFVVFIINARNKLVEFMDGSNILLKILDPQAIRETIKDLRWEIRTIKLNQDISELDIIEYQEKMYEEKEEFPF